MSGAWCVARGRYRERGACCVVRGASRPNTSGGRWRSRVDDFLKPLVLQDLALAIYPRLQLDERTTNLRGGIANVERFTFRHISQTSRNLDLAGELAVRPDSDLKELRELVRPAPTAAFGDIGTDRDCGSPHLGDQAELLVPGEPGRQGVDRNSKVLSVRPASELPEVLHRNVILGSPAGGKSCVGRGWCVVRGAFCVQGPSTAPSFQRLHPRHSSQLHDKPRTTHPASQDFNALGTTHNAPHSSYAPRTTHHALRDLS